MRILHIQNRINPPLALYLDMIQNGQPIAFRAQVDEAAEHWRKFAHELYNLVLDPRIISQMPRSIKFVYNLLRVAGYIQQNQITAKGRFFVHDLTKTVVESLPFPVSNPSAIANYSEYERHASAAQLLLSRTQEVTEPSQDNMPTETQH